MMLPQTLKALSHNSNLVRLNRCMIRMFSERKIPTTNDSIPENVEHKDISKLLEESANFNEADDPRWATNPYPEGTLPRMSENENQIPKQNPLDKSIILFPGQGTLKVGQVKQYLKFPDAKYLFEIANETLGYDLLKICSDGPQHILDRTEYNQPATVIASLAALEKLKEERPRAIETCVAIAGYSVGELTALIFSGAIGLEAGLKLVRVRAAAMQSAADLAPQGMLHAWCGAQVKVGDACAKAKTWALDMGTPDPECRIAIYLYTCGKIFAGSEEALKYLERNGRKLGLRQLKRLPVSGAFHTPLMTPALDMFKKAIKTVEFEAPRVPVYSNIDAKTYRTTQQIIKYLPKQIVSPVRWEQIMHVLYGRAQGTAFPRTFDIGSGGTLRTILQRSNDAHIHPISCSLKCITYE